MFPQLFLPKKKKVIFRPLSCHPLSARQSCSAPFEHRPHGWTETPGFFLLTETERLEFSLEQPTDFSETQNNETWFSPFSADVFPPNKKHPPWCSTWHLPGEETVGETETLQLQSAANLSQQKRILYIGENCKHQNWCFKNASGF